MLYFCGRTPAYLKKHGHTASIMDYARFNYVAQPEDKIPQQYLFPRIGEYDKWAIEWGYKPSHAGNTAEDTKIVRQWIAKRLAGNPILWFGEGELKKTDARNLREDLGDNAMKAGTYGIKNLRRILPQLPQWTYEEGGVQQNLSVAYKAVKEQYSRYIGHVLQNIGGIYETLRADGESASVYDIVPAEKQKQALEFFNTQLFDTPLWILDPEVMRRVGEPVSPDFVADMQVRGLNSLLDMQRLNRISANMRQFGAKALPLHDYLSIIHQGIWKELGDTAKVVINSYRRDLQKSYLGALMGILMSKDPAVSETDASSIVRADLVKLQQQIEQALPKTADTITQYHLQDLQSRIKNLLTVQNS